MAEKKESSSSRNYVVLKFWEEAATIEASGAKQAIDLVAVDFGRGRYAAIPERYWSELEVLVEQQAPKITLKSVARSPKNLPLPKEPAESEKQPALA